MTVQPSRVERIAAELEPIEAHIDMLTGAISDFDTEIRMLETELEGLRGSRWAADQELNRYQQQRDGRLAEMAALRDSWNASVS